MDINPYIGNKTHFINSLLESQLSGFVFTILGSFKTDIILDKLSTWSAICPENSKRCKDQISLLATEGDKRLLPALPK